MRGDAPVPIEGASQIKRDQLLYKDLMLSGSFMASGEAA